MARESSDSDLPLFSPEEIQQIQQKLLLSPGDRPSLNDPMASSNISSLLSASSYPLPEPLVIPQMNREEQFPAGGLLETPSSEEIDRATQSQSNPKQSQKQRHSRANSADQSSKKRNRGRPRKTTSGPTSKDPEERRRQQIRLAQRAYRSRQEESISRYQNRIAKLETAVEEMSNSMLFLSQQLIQSDALTAHPNLVTNLRDTVSTCLRSARETSTSNEPETPEASSSREPLTSLEQQTRTPPQPYAVNSVATPPLEISPDYCEGFEPFSSGYPFVFDQTEMSPMELSIFIRRLHIACLFQAYFALRDRSITLDRLQRPFGFLLTFMSRDRITSYFEAAIHSKFNRQRLDGWNVPFFSLGGAGTHYLQSNSANQPSLSQKWVTVQDPSAHFSNIPPEMDGEWFTIGDLEVFLRQKGVHLLANPAVETSHSSPLRTGTNVARLMHALINKCICLGRSPGFRRCDVEKALSVSMLT